MVISQNTVISVRTKQRENLLWTAIPAVNSPRRFNKFALTVFQEMVVESNDMILVSFFSEDNVLSDEIKICYIFEYQSTKVERSAFWGTPGIERYICVYQHTGVPAFTPPPPPPPSSLRAMGDKYSDRLQNLAHNTHHVV